MLCEYCRKDASARKNRVQSKINHGFKNRFCSSSCSIKYQVVSKGLELTKEYYCVKCKKVFKRIFSQSIRSKNCFCSKSCAAKYNNAHKSYGIRRSKLEIWLERRLVELYPDLEILFNYKKIIESELDIYIPSLNLAFEINGIFHYKPIFGQEKLEQIQTNDSKKSSRCTQENISLLIINCSKLTHFKVKEFYKYLGIIEYHINILVDLFGSQDSPRHVAS